MKKVLIENLAQIKKAEISIADFTVFTGAQATGKSIALQMLKLIEDADDIAKKIKRYGYDWDHEWAKFLELYFGEGMNNIWNKNSKITVNGKIVDFNKEIYKKGKAKKEKVFLIPAQRVLTLKNGWPRNFGDYESTDPYVVKEFSENIRRLMEAGIGKGEAPVFPQEGRIKKAFRDKINQNIFNGAEVKLDKAGFRKRIILDVNGTKLPFMVWSAGQREFMPLLLGLYWLMPSSRASKRENIDIVIIEEAEMGLHPRAISSLMLLFLELIYRGYKVILSTHSPVILDVVWAIRTIKENNADPLLLMELFELSNNHYVKELCEEIIENKSFKTYYFDKNDRGVAVKDISALDPGAEENYISGWGGLTEFSGKASEIVAKAVSGI